MTHHRRQSGLTLLEVLLSITLLSVAILALMPLLPTAMLTDADARTRTRAIAAAETWLDRYRQGLEPLRSTRPCTGTAQQIHCTYAYEHDYTRDTDIPSHLANHDALTSAMRDFRADLRATHLRTDRNHELWDVSVTITWNSRGGERHVELGTHILR